MVITRSTGRKRAAVPATCTYSTCKLCELRESPKRMKFPPSRFYKHVKNSADSSVYPVCNEVPEVEPVIILQEKLIATETDSPSSSESFKSEDVTFLPKDDTVISVYPDDALCDEVPEVEPVIILQENLIVTETDSPSSSDCYNSEGITFLPKADSSVYPVCNEVPEVEPVIILQEKLIATETDSPSSSESFKSEDVTFLPKDDTLISVYPDDALYDEVPEVEPVIILQENLIVTETDSPSSSDCYNSEGITFLPNADSSVYPVCDEVPEVEPVIILQEELIATETDSPSSSESVNSEDVTFLPKDIRCYSKLSTNENHQINKECQQRVQQQVKVPIFEFTDDDSIVMNSVSSDSDDDESVVFNLFGNINRDKQFFRDYDKVFFRKTEKSMIGKKGQVKKTTRVYKSKHSCIFCSKLVTKIHSHLLSKHKDEDDVKALQMATSDYDKNKFLTLLRNKGDHVHNLKMKEKKEGEILLPRRPSGLIQPNLDDYSPCPKCFLWVANLSKHYSYSKRCVMKNEDLSKRQVEFQSQSCNGEMFKGASLLLKEEVLAKMNTSDPVTVAIINDPLLIELGNTSLKTNIRNILRRGSYASNKMRLCARALIKVRDQYPSITFDDVLVPSMFRAITQSVTEISGVDGEHIAHPSNALKMGYHLKELSDLKETDALLTKDMDRAEDARIFRRLCEKNWAKEVSSLACSTLADRRFSKVIELPLPNDLERLSSYLVNEARSIVDIQNLNQYMHAVVITETRLLTYNKRRPGELESLQLQHYMSRPKQEQHMEQYINSLSVLEKHLLTSLEMVMVRGKRGRPVPIIIPVDIQHVMSLLTQAKIRKLIGVQQSKYMFAAPRNSAVVRAGESLAKVLECLELERPELIKSTMLRKYLATTIQVMSLSRTEMEWVAEHLGHSVAIHEEFYRMMSSTIEKAKIAKLLILADSGKIDQFREKSLNELTLDEIPVFSDLTDSDVPNAEEQSSPGFTYSGEFNKTPGEQSIQPWFEESMYPQQQQQQQAETPQPYASGATKKWNYDDTEQIKQYFASNIKTLKVPGKKECEQFIRTNPMFSKFTCPNIKDKVIADALSCGMDRLHVVLGTARG